MSIPLKLFLDWKGVFERKGVFRNVRVKANLNLMWLVNKWRRALEHFVDESDFQKEDKWYILSNNSQFEVCSTVSSDINGSLAGISDFSEDIVSESSSDSGDISSHDGSKSDKDSDYNPKPSTSTISSSFNRK